MESACLNVLLGNCMFTQQSSTAPHPNLRGRVHDIGVFETRYVLPEELIGDQHLFSPADLDPREVFHIEDHLNRANCC